VLGPQAVTAVRGRAVGGPEAQVYTQPGFDLGFLGCSKSLLKL
jgi:hypothetical protein